MILRKPRIEDIYKASLFLSDDEEEQKTVLQDWLYQSVNNKNFYSLVIAKEKEVVGVLTALVDYENGQVVIGRLDGSSAFKIRLIEKLIKDVNPDKIVWTVEDVDDVAAHFNFKVKSYNLLYEKVQEVVEDNTTLSEALDIMESTKESEQ